MSKVAYDLGVQIRIDTDNVVAASQKAAVIVECFQAALEDSNLGAIRAWDCYGRRITDEATEESDEATP